MQDDIGRPVGWHTDDNGVRRFWDGETWLVPQAESSESEHAETRTRKSRNATAQKKPRVSRKLIAAGTALVLAAGVFVAVTQVREHRANEEAKVVAAEAAERAKAAREKKAATLLEEQEREAKATQAAADAQAAASKKKRDAEVADQKHWDDHMTSGKAGDVWEVMETGSLYFRYGDGSQFDCGRWDCVMVEVVSTKGCSGGVYVEASIEDSGGSVVGWTNVRIGALKAEQVGADLLEDSRGMGSSFNVSEVKCYK